MLGNIGFCKTDSVLDIILNAQTCWNRCYHSDKQKANTVPFHVNKNAKTKPTKLRAAQALFQMAARQSWKDISMFKCNILVLRQMPFFCPQRYGVQHNLPISAVEYLIESNMSFNWAELFDVLGGERLIDIAT